MLKINIALIIIQIRVIVKNIKISESETCLNSRISSQEREEQIPAFWELQQIFLAKKMPLTIFLKIKFLILKEDTELKIAEES